MNGVDGLGRRKKSFKERLGFGCCGGPIWGIRPTTMSVRDDDDDGDVGDIEIHHQLPEQPRLHQNGASAPNSTHDVSVLDQPCYVVLSDHHASQSDGEAQSRANNIEDSNPTGTQMASSMNLAAALAAERQYRAAHEPDGLSGSDLESRLRTNRSTTTNPGTPLRMSLLRLLEETDGVEAGKMGDALVVDDCGGGGGGRDGVCDSMCCVCMGRKKGAAFIPCGHTFCRVCSRELWLNRGSCPLCNRPILEILDIF